VAPPPSQEQRSAEIAGWPYWDSPLPSEKLPYRGKDNCLVFEDYVDFRPNLTPEEVLQAGSFGGGYFRPIQSGVTRKSYGDTVYKEFPASWFEGLDIAKQVTSSRYNVSVNRYLVKSGNSLEHWESRGWMKPQDPYGWFQWYCRFFLGRRTLDDARQVGRWVSAIGPKGRWRTFLVGQCVRQGKAWDDPTGSPVTRQTLLHWGFHMTKADFDVLAPAIRDGKSVIYLGPVVQNGAVSKSVAKRPSSPAKGPLKKRAVKS